jgi:very-short-patch-repair endonuclease
MGLKKLTTEEFKLKYSNHYGDDFNLDLIDYINADTKVKIKCVKHGVFEVIPYKLFKNQISPCKHCRKEQTTRVIDIKTFIEKANQLHNNEYDYHKTHYSGNNNDLIITCRIHGDFTMRADSHLSGLNKCPKCKPSHSLNKEEVILRFNKIHNSKYEYPEFIYNTVYDKIKIKCPKHGVFEQKIMLHLRGHGCKECNSRKKDIKYFSQKASLLHNNKYDYSHSIYNHSQEKINITCPIHGEFEQIARDHLQGWGCRQCAIENKNFVSSYENTIYNFIKQHNPNLEIIKSYNKERKEIDLYIPGFKLGIEINGNYWHSHLYKNKKYHKEKSDFFNEKGINIFHLWEHQILNKFDIVKSMILNKLNLTPNKIYARKCNIKEISGKEYKLFCDNNHMQGHSPAKIKLGLYYSNELVAVMSFSSFRINLGNKKPKDNEYELIRFCNKLNTNVVGGASKLLKYFINNYNPLKIISYADNDYSEGKLYNVLGFKDLGFTNISYIYYEPKTQSIYNRFKFRKSELIKMGFDKNQSEFEITEKLGMYRIYNSGISKKELNLL